MARIRSASSTATGSPLARHLSADSGAAVPQHGSARLPSPTASEGSGEAAPLRGSSSEEEPAEPRHLKKKHGSPRARSHAKSAAGAQREPAGSPMATQGEGEGRNLTKSRPAGRSRSPRPVRSPATPGAARGAKPTSVRPACPDNLLVRIHCIIVMIMWTGLAPWEFEFPFSGSLT